jgi:hypothetical protein
VPENTIPAAGNGGHREVVISNLKLHQKNSLGAFFSATLPGGLVLHGRMFHERIGARWIGFSFGQSHIQARRTAVSISVRWPDRQHWICIHPDDQAGLIDKLHKAFGVPRGTLFESCSAAFVQSCSQPYFDRSRFDDFFSSALRVHRYVIRSSV